MMLSQASTQFPDETPKVWDAESPDRQMIYFMDISRAYFNAKVDESDPVYVGLPPEIDVPPRSCALLQRHMYVKRRAADGWQSECSGSFVEFGFTQGMSSACVCVHAEREIMDHGQPPLRRLQMLGVATTAPVVGGPAQVEV